ncbi:non-specific lipid transfer protein GPI-anchored 31-like [Henckelia pumila]|uniref:non-specific lipid transfer protein GPI-anchored 31-like n=1 Tax=Henckelia pumila TaxID=405737 RepID=UPI003C6E1642
MKLNILILECCILASLSTTSATQRLRRTAAAPAPSTDCSTLVMDNMITCMQFLSATATETKPDADCCSGLKKVMKTNSDCLCSAIKSAPSMGLVLNLTRAGEMPSDCGIKNAPPISKCTAADTPTPTPAPSPANPPNLPPAAQPPAQVPSSSPSPSPTPSNPKSGASSISATFSVIFIQLICISIFFALA